MSWLKNLNDLKDKTGKTCKQIAEGTKQPDRTIIRIFKGETETLFLSLIILVEIFQRFLLTLALLLVVLTFLLYNKKKTDYKPSMTFYSLKRIC